MLADQPLRSARCNKDCSSRVRLSRPWAQTRRCRSCACSQSRRLRAPRVDIVALADFVALDDICGIDFVAGLRINFAVFDTTAGVLVELMEADLLALGCSRKQGNWT